VTPTHSDGWAEIVERDAVYRRPTPHARLRLADDPPPFRGGAVVGYQTAGEWRYNVVEVGAESETTLRRLEATQVTFDVDAFRRHLIKCQQTKELSGRQLYQKYRLDIGRATLRPRGRNVRGELRWTLAFE